jgi:hypothetical protein
MKSNIKSNTPENKITVEYALLMCFLVGISRSNLKLNGTKSDSAIMRENPSLFVFNLDELPSKKLPLYKESWEMDTEGESLLEVNASHKRIFANFLWSFRSGMEVWF